MQNLSERAILMRFSCGLPGEVRQDQAVTAKVKAQEHMGQRAGKWDKFLYPPEALEAIKSMQGKARAYHNAVTLPFDNGIGILPAALIKEYGDRMRDFKSKIDSLVESTFLADPSKWLDWAAREHNGTFDPSLYPGADAPDPLAAELGGKKYKLDPEVFRSEMRAKFYFRSEPLPVPNAKHFENTVASLLGTDLESVNLRVADATEQAQRELLKRLIAPVQVMVTNLSKEKCRIHDSMIDNIKEITRVASALNLAGDPVLDKMILEMNNLTKIDPEKLRKDEGARKSAKAEADAMLAKLSGYKWTA